MIDDFLEDLAIISEIVGRLLKKEPVWIMDRLFGRIRHRDVSE
jgi:hypothetical protein